ncbi:hypothetical protein GUJ93_ZPchr0013g37339 [Zizania palustris]|uniref:Uncharacterized protein n=1 Tax=Zizania palustris TaxID=103762 RepID=A0A8J5X2E1_ZIZPA|nr:hypothetical protein GUJ93_ZPchr0013g37339 [Zizania palustris]
MKPKRSTPSEAEGSIPKGAYAAPLGESGRTFGVRGLLRVPEPSGAHEDGAKPRGLPEPVKSGGVLRRPPAGRRSLLQCVGTPLRGAAVVLLWWLPAPRSERSPLECPP